MRDGERLLPQLSPRTRPPCAVLDDMPDEPRRHCVYPRSPGAAIISTGARLVAVVDAQPWDEKGGGYSSPLPTASDLSCDHQARADNATPSGNGVMARCCCGRHSHRRGRYAAREEALIAALSGEITKNSFPALDHCSMPAESPSGRLQVVILGARGAAIPKR